MPHAPPTAKQYTAYGFPWFDYYTDGPSVKPTRALQKVKPVSAELDVGCSFGEDTTAEVALQASASNAAAASHKAGAPSTVVESDQVVDVTTSVVASQGQVYGHEWTGLQVAVGAQRDVRLRQCGTWHCHCVGQHDYEKRKKH